MAVKEKMDKGEDVAEAMEEEQEKREEESSNGNRLRLLEAATTAACKTFSSTPASKEEREDCCCCRVADNEEEWLVVCVVESNEGREGRGREGEASCCIENETLAIPKERDKKIKDSGTGKRKEERRGKRERDVLLSS